MFCSTLFNLTAPARARGHGAGKTANSGYLTRRLVDVAQDMVVLEEDCGTDDGLMMHPIIEGGDVVEPLHERILGRVTATDLYRPVQTKSSILPEPCWAKGYAGAGGTWH